MTEPIELVRRDAPDGPALLFACPTCGVARSPKTFGGGPEARSTAERLARECCEPATCACGRPLGRTKGAGGYTRCARCLQLDVRAGARRRWQEAHTKVHARDYDGGAAPGQLVDDDDVVYIDDLVDERSGTDFDFAWGTRPLELDDIGPAAELLENWIADIGEDAAGRLDLAGLDRLLAAWLDEQRPAFARWWTIDNDVAVCFAAEGALEDCEGEDDLEDLARRCAVASRHWGVEVLPEEFATRGPESAAEIAFVERVRAIMERAS